jgi:phosphogluconate dehydratase
VEGTLQVRVSEAEWAAREQAGRSDAHAADAGAGIGRELFAGMRRNVRSAEEGAVSWL